MATLLIACVGSPFGADSFGLAVAAPLQRHPVAMKYSPHLNIAVYDRPGVALLGEFKRFEGVLLVDAVKAPEPGKHGRVLRLNIEDLQQQHERWSSHDVGVAEALALGKVLNTLPAYVTIFGIGIDANNQQLPTLSQQTVLVDTVMHEADLFMQGNLCKSNSALQ